jgi:hypothetical protein
MHYKCKKEKKKEKKKHNTKMGREVERNLRQKGERDNNVEACYSLCYSPTKLLEGKIYIFYHFSYTLFLSFHYGLIFISLPVVFWTSPLGNFLHKMLPTLKSPFSPLHFADFFYISPILILDNNHN